MSGQNNENNHQEAQTFLQNFQEQHGFKITPCQSNLENSDREGFKMLRLTPEQKMQISELLQHVPAVAATGAMAGAYTVSFPQGLPHTLMTLKRGGFGSQIVDMAGKKEILGSASFYPMVAQAAVYGVFTAMSIATGQFFLVQINKELHMINQKLDEILNFLYEEKKAELLSEVFFIKYACDNYDSIMFDEAQRTATIASIQQAKKIAMKDIEFYIKHLDSKIDSGAKQKFEALVKLKEDEIIPNINSLEMSLQLYCMSSLMEAYYARNFEEAYVEYVENDINSYVERCSKKEYSIIDKMDAYFNTPNIPNNQKEKKEILAKCKQKLSDRRELINNGENNMKKLSAVLKSTNKSTQYYIETDGSVYYKTL
ncbi:MAG: hypothetical protein K2H41_02865 [Acetatifactor sp.]|nr:hypothetical protein [Acetatifactor sp.]